MSPAPVIRAIGVADRAALLDHWSATWRATYSSAHGAAVVERMIAAVAADLAVMLPGTGERGLAAVLGERIVGTAVFVERGRIAHLWGMYVRPQAQRCGIGTALMERVARSIAAAELVEVRALETSPWAIAFWRRLGFDEIGREHQTIAPDHPPVPALVMTASPAGVLRRVRRLRGDGGV